MNTRQKHWFFFIATAIGAIVVVNLAILLMWTDMSEEERVFGKQIFSRVVVYGTLAMVVLFFISSQFILYIFRNYISPIETLTDETRLIAAANAKYRIKPVGAMETHNLTSVINDLADSYISLKSDVKNIVTESKEGFDEEKLRLETLMNMIDEGVIVCNHDGRILMCNHRAYEVFNSVDHNEVGRFSRLGLGRSIFSVFNRISIIYALEEVQNYLTEKKEIAIYKFITTRYKVQYLNVKILPIMKNTNVISGYVYTFRDITDQIAQNDIENYKDQFIVLDEVISIVNMKTQNQFTFSIEKGIWLNIQYQNIIDFFVELCDSLKRDVKSIHIGMSNENRLRINWSGEDVNFELRKRKLNELVLNRNCVNGNVSIEIDAPVHRQESARQIEDPRKSRPIYGHADIFDHTTQSTEMDDVLLKDLTFVVFDTETTGLDPSGGDEIISIAGVRLFEGKVNTEEIFDELVNPQRSIPLTSLKIHEIYPEMLDNKLTIDKVLPLFHEFAHNAVLVAHNAAFDMRFLQLKEEETGIKFNNPVLDTMLLSAACNPSQELHNLEDIAEKCGVKVFGRHTALGDAMVTAEVFLKLIPILEVMGIKTLGEAREVSSKTHLSKIKF